MKQILPIGASQIAAAMETLGRYRSARAGLEQRILENEQWYRLRHWQSMRNREKGEVEPVSGWLFNAIANKHASAMDNFPTPTVLPREESDRALAKTLSAIVPVILERNDFEQVYSRVWDSKLRSGTGVYGVFWDSEGLRGLGDVSIQRVDLLNLYWEPGITDLQQSKNIFHVELQDNDALLERYPGITLPGVCQWQRYHYDESVDTSGKSAVVDWYYKKSTGGRTVLHYCKFVGDNVLFATENEPIYRDLGWYDHGLYPFLADTLFPCEGTPWGFGYIDLGKSAQEYIDRGNQAVLMNLLSNARPRFFLRSDGAVNREEYADLSRDFVTADGNLGADSIRPIEGKPLNDIYITVLRDKIDELKEVTGNRDVSTGGTSGGVTAASAIAAMQEAGSRLDRDANRASYRVFRQLVKMVISLVRQFYSTPRCFRILGSEGEEFLAFGGHQIPWEVDFDITVAAQKASPYSRLQQNELALQFFGAGFFRPELANQALLCLEMMDFDRKAFVMNKIRSQAAAFYGTPEKVETPASDPVTAARQRTAEATAP